MKLNPKEIKAKMQALDELLQMSQDMESDDLDHGLKGLKKVTVASNDPEGLEEGLEKAKELVEAKEPAESLEEDMEDMQPESEMSLPESKEDDSKLELDNELPLASEVKKKKKFSFVD